jgi:hypothetical protein
MGFLRTLVQAEPYGFTIEQGKDLLSQLKSSKESRFDFLADGLGLAQLPRWVRGPKQFTDGHLLGLAKAHGAEMATWMSEFRVRLSFPARLDGACVNSPAEIR